MGHRNKNLKNVRDQLSEIDSRMKTSLGTNVELRNNMYRQQILLEKKFMRQIWEVGMELMQELEVKDIMKIITNGMMLSHKEIDTVKQWLLDGEGSFISGVFPCIIALKNGEADENLHKPFVTSIDEEKEFARILKGLNGKARMWTICQLYDLEDYETRELGSILYGEVQAIIDTAKASAWPDVSQFLLYSSHGKIYDITPPIYRKNSIGSNLTGKNVVHVYSMGIPISIFGKRRLVLNAREYLDSIDQETLTSMSRFLSHKLSMNVVVGDPVLDEFLSDFLIKLDNSFTGTQDEPEWVEHISSRNVPGGRNIIIPPSGNVRESVMNFFYLASMKCSRCGTIHSSDAEATGIRDEEEWDRDMDIYLDFLVSRKDATLKVLATDDEINRNWLEASDGLRRILLGDFDI